MRKCCPCLKFLRRSGSRVRKVTPKTQLLNQNALSLSLDKSNLCVTSVKEDRTFLEESRPKRRPVVKKEASPSPTRLRPKVYSVMKGTSSICHTPVPDTSALSKKVVIRKPEPRSAELHSDGASKPSIMSLKKERSYSEDRGKQELPSPVA